MKIRGKAHCHCGKEIPDEQYFEEEDQWIAIQYCSQKCKDEDSGFDCRFCKDEDFEK